MIPLKTIIMMVIKTIDSLTPNTCSLKDPEPLDDTSELQTSIKMFMFSNEAC